ncbi:hypothetical protein [Bradyrhizobium erythrophlei]|jgi:hypothetical protein|uniref:Uncharacterized protein n=1 Tax=Bradyrhizobium erythrophlei TaxID=1437360 RepID=A0A1M7UJI6_9BRAD|nr:hypothetical protein [Bradyrhizobium erythrophlei]SHN83090.1 hypothetical protein SAMN05444170_5397 [Bradyrhizobium erythrophlei]
MWIGGTLVAVMIVIFGVILVVDTYLAFRDPSDPLGAAAQPVPGAGSHGEKVAEKK